MKFQRKKVAIALGIGGVALVAGGMATAQDIRVNVTGTNIKRVDSETAAPIETITREDIQASGLQTIQDVVRQITANNNGSIAPSFTNGFSASGAGVSLRGLGPNNTLVLLNGRRMANFGLADDGHASYADLAQIPFDAVERIEVLKDGASAIYGSDAVAGVVNVILRQQFTGFTATATAGTAYNGEGSQFKVAATGGIGDLTKDKYNAFLSIDYQKQDAYAFNKTRDYMASNDLRGMGWWDQRLGNPNTVSTGSLSGMVRSVTRDRRLAGPVRGAGRVPVGAVQPRRRVCPRTRQVLPVGQQGLGRPQSRDRALQRRTRAARTTSRPTSRGTRSCRTSRSPPTRASRRPACGPTGIIRRTTRSTRRSPLPSSCRLATRTTRSTPITAAPACTTRWATSAAGTTSSRPTRSGTCWA